MRRLPRAPPAAGVRSAAARRRAPAAPPGGGGAPRRGTGARGARAARNASTERGSGERKASQTSAARSRVSGSTARRSGQRSSSSAASSSPSPANRGRPSERSMQISRSEPTGTPAWATSARAPGRAGAGLEVGQPEDDVDRPQDASVPTSTACVPRVRLADGSSSRRRRAVARRPLSGDQAVSSSCRPVGAFVHARQASTVPSELHGARVPAAESPVVRDVEGHVRTLQHSVRLGARVEGALLVTRRTSASE